MVYDLKVSERLPEHALPELEPIAVLVYGSERQLVVVEECQRVAAIPPLAVIDAVRALALTESH